MKRKKLLEKQMKSRDGIDRALAEWAGLTKASQSGPYTRVIECLNMNGELVKVTCVYQLEQR